MMTSEHTKPNSADDVQATDTVPGEAEAPVDPGESSAPETDDAVPVVPDVSETAADAEEHTLNEVAHNARPTEHDVIAAIDAAAPHTDPADLGEAKLIRLLTAKEANQNTHLSSFRSIGFKQVMEDSHGRRFLSINGTGPRIYVNGL